MQAGRVRKEEEETGRIRKVLSHKEREGNNQTYIGNKIERQGGESCCLWCVRDSNEILEYDVAVPTINEGDNEEEEFVNLGKGNKPYTLFYTLLQKKFNVAGIPRYYMKYFVILHENRKKTRTILWSITNYFVYFLVSPATLHFLSNSVYLKA